MIRPLDEALIDFEKTYRQTFKEPLYQHQEYTKRQLIYNYAAVGSEFIYKNVISDLKAKKPKPRDLEDLINQWNDPTVKVQQITNQPIKKPDPPLTPQEEEDLKDLKKQVEVLKKQKMIIKNRHERSIYFRKEIEILFKTKNLSMLSVDSMRGHSNELKPCLGYNNRNRMQKYQNHREVDKGLSRNYDDFRYHNGGRYEEGNRDSHRRYDEREDSRRNDERENYRKNDYYGRESRGKEDYRQRERSRHGDEREYQGKRDSYDRSEGFYSNKNPNSYYKPEQYSTQGAPYSSSQFNRNDIAYNKSVSNIEISSGHNQNYQVSYDQPYDQRPVYPPPSQSSKANSFYQYESNTNSQYGFRVSSSESHKYYQEK